MTHYVSNLLHIELLRRINLRTRVYEEKLVEKSYNAARIRLKRRTFVGKTAQSNSAQTQTTNVCRKNRINQPRSGGYFGDYLEVLWVKRRSSGGISPLLYLSIILISPAYETAPFLAS